MQNIKHVISYSPKLSFRVKSVCDHFDYAITDLKNEWSLSIPDKEPWKIGIVVGPSGSGKTRMCEKIFGKPFDPKWSVNPIIDDFEDKITVSEITNALTKVGLGSVQTWLLPYSALSVGQKFRATLARAIFSKNEIIFIDEFTSAVDRITAKTISMCVSSMVQNDTANKKYVFATCHYDVLDWVDSDWIVNLQTSETTWGRLRCRPKTKIDIYRIGKSAWGIFKKYHYLSHDISKSAICYVAKVDGCYAAFLAIIKYPHKQLKSVYRIHRVVVLPEFGGLGIAREFCNFIAQKTNGAVYISTSHLPFSKSLLKSGQWGVTRKFSFSAKAAPTARVSNKNHRTASKTIGLKYIGDKCLNAQ